MLFVYILNVLRCLARIAWMLIEKRAEDRGIAYLTKNAARSFWHGPGFMWVNLIVPRCFLPLGLVAGSPASVDECEWIGE